LKEIQTNIKQLLEAVSCEDSEQAFKSLFQAYSGRIMRYIHLFVKPREAAEELVEDVFFAIWEQRKTLHEINDFNAYIYTIARFKAFNYLRISKPDFIDLEAIPIDLFASTITTPEDDFISKELVEAANKAIEQLPPKTKIAFKLVREDGLKYKEAAECLGISVKTLEAHLTAAMKAISQILRLRP
jgi:RNA polymerase sigma-70 factor (ECF subfamily)